MTIHEAARKLETSLNAGSQPYEPNAMVGIAETTGTIFVYSHVPKSSYQHFPLLEEIDGYPIVWQFDVGRAVAAEENGR